VAWELLASAKVLGFGCDATNVARLSKGAHFCTKNIYGSAFGTTERERAAIGRLWPIQLTGDKGDPVATLRWAPGVS